MFKDPLCGLYGHCEHDEIVTELVRKMSVFRLINDIDIGTLSMNIFYHKQRSDDSKKINYEEYLNGLYNYYFGVSANCCYIS